MTMYSTGGYLGSDADTGLGIMPFNVTDVQPTSPAADTQAWVAYSERGARERIMASARRQARRDAVRRRTARVLCTLLAVGLLIFGFTDLINAGVDVAQHGLALAALVMGGGTLVALIFALTEN